jgi:hypothetical protein
LTNLPVITDGILSTGWITSRETKEIQSSSAEEESYEQESGEGAVDVRVPARHFVWVFAATALSCSASLDFLTIFYSRRGSE